MFKLGLLIYILSFLLVPQFSWAQEYLVSSSKELRKRVSDAKPGDVIIMKAGRWHDQQIKIKGEGSADKPILVKAERLGETILTGSSYLHVGGSHITIQGLKFTQGHLDDRDHVIRLSGSHHRLTETAIIDYSPENMETRYFWVSLFGRKHVVDHNSFSGHNHSGVTAVVWLKDKNDGHHYIGHNYFGPRVYGHANGFETIRIGTGKSSTVNAQVLVEHNVFEGADGEIETISNKSNQNIYRFNTFIDTAGTLTIRQGKYVVVAHNYFLGNNKKHTGGVRVVGAQHLVYGNYFENLAGRAQGVISLTAGTGKHKNTRLTLYPQVEQTVIAGNILYNNTDTNVFLNAGLGSKKRYLLPEQIWFAHNVFYNATSHVPLFGGEANQNLSWQNNFALGAELGFAADVKLHSYQAEPQTKPSISLAQAKEAIAYQSLNCEKVIAELDEKIWPKPLFYALCKRVGSSAELDNMPKTKKDVGVSWAL